MITTKTIKVNGSHEYAIQPEYKANMIVSLNNVYSHEYMTFTEVIDNYLVELAAAGITKSELSDDPLGYQLMGYEKEGTIVSYITTSLKKLQKFLEVKVEGVIKSDVTFKLETSNSQIEKYAKAAITDAKNKAEMVAKSIGKKIGDIVHIEDSNYTSSPEALYYGNTLGMRTYYAAVTFELQ